MSYWCEAVIPCTLQDNDLKSRRDPSGDADSTDRRTPTSTLSERLMARADTRKYRRVSVMTPGGAAAGPGGRTARSREPSWSAMRGFVGLSSLKIVCAHINFCCIVNYGCWQSACLCLNRPPHEEGCVRYVLQRVESMTCVTGSVAEGDLH